MSFRDTTPPEISVTGVTRQTGNGQGGMGNTVTVTLSASDLESPLTGGTLNVTFTEHIPCGTPSNRTDSKSAAMSGGSSSGTASVTDVTGTCFSGGQPGGPLKEFEPVTITYTVTSAAATNSVGLTCTWPNTCKP